MCKMRHCFYGEPEINGYNSCLQGGYSPAEKIRLGQNGWLGRKCMITIKRKIQSSWEFRDRWLRFQQKRQ